MAFSILSRASIRNVHNTCGLSMPWRGGGEIRTGYKLMLQSLNMVHMCSVPPFAQSAVSILQGKSMRSYLAV